MTFTQRRNRLTTHFSERIPIVKLLMIVTGKKMEGQCDIEHLNKSIGLSRTISPCFKNSIVRYLLLNCVSCS
jgi:hypothetical protein